MDYTIKIGGEAGQGIQTIGDTLAVVFAKSGYHVFSHQDYESRIRGGHNFYQIRLSDRVISCSRDKVDIVVALDKESIARYEQSLTEYGQIIYDSQSIKEKHEGNRFLDVPFVDLAIRHGGNKIMANTVATGAVLGMLGMDIEVLLDILKETFKKKGDAVIKANVDSAIAGYDFAVKNCLRCSFAPAEVSGSKMLIAGNDAIGFGAVASGLKFYSAYPMTPGTSIMLYVASKAKEYGIVVEQAEDEIAAINMALGASFAGVRAMTGTSGGGFALMVEGLSLAAITETPVVIAIAQRPGPATGLPTKTAQADLLFALYSAHGEFPRVIFAPGSPEECFFLTNKAFDLAEKYQIPAIILTDQYLADSQWTYDGFDLSRLVYKDYRIRGEEAKDLKNYKRHLLTEDGVSPFAVPGDGNYVVVTDSDEHDEDGHITEDIGLSIKMVQKRLHKKLPNIIKEINPPKFYGDTNPEIVLVGWGSMYGLLKESVDILKENHKIAMLHFSEIYPFASLEKFDYLSVLKNSKKAICIEQNVTSQLARLIACEIGFRFDYKINKYDGRPFTLETLLGEINAIIR
ncbi:MAG: 2-oxoacid:acceptor oxidoreductase subunit alpha [Thermodesulfovibrionales bacterium]|nr:2-oxoacid:acceptor oxidoreductase subunit alpha [Thermodesulfovibrionales bacterium]